ncbi:nitrogen fixation protein NifQ [Parasulfuritortus cantonensis]|uniref:Nitrogen fixation protein NifQ n=1 Tax=Parasulfuritortus cantonensis TaxID=2528202 RepID=A0A4R1B5W2_9PROT|nr:nitrogen fixation protein NifQ [Parasulfuritortus cantonensis]TCJ11568.1 nitrogen fixation protein NifQ [Parasulfuritortus cantonensis]
MNRALSFEQLMQSCHDVTDPVARALAGALDSAARGVIQAPSPSLGLDRARFRALLARHFPILAAPEEDGEGCPPLASDEFDDLVQLFLAHRSHDGEEVEWLAHAIASACMGGDHLYQDMGLPNRQALSDLLNEHFTALFVKNVGNMKWKKFFYKQLCDQAEVKVCQAPSCKVCNDYWNCFGPEDDTFPANLAVLAGRAPADAAA